MATFKKYVLYIGHDLQDSSVFCPGSRIAVDLAKSIGDDVLIQNTDVLIEKGQQLPKWLDGTPILVDMESKEANKGSAAVERLRALLSPPAEMEAPPTMEDMHGCMPNGQRHLHAENDNFEPSSISSKESFLMNRDDKVTDTDLETYMKMRNSS